MNAGAAPAFAAGAAGSLLVALAVDAGLRGLNAGGLPPLQWAPDALHLSSVATPAYLVGAALALRQAATAGTGTSPPAAGEGGSGERGPRRPGPVPRAFWTLTCGVGLRAIFGLIEGRAPFYAAASLAGTFLELAAIAMLVVPPSPPKAPAGSSAA